VACELIRKFNTGDIDVDLPVQDQHTCVDSTPEWQQYESIKKHGSRCEAVKGGGQGYHNNSSTFDGKARMQHCH
jgi:hypothetical protein